MPVLSDAAQANRHQAPAAPAGPSGTLQPLLIAAVAGAAVAGVAALVSTGSAATAAAVVAALLLLLATAIAVTGWRRERDRARLAADAATERSRRAEEKEERLRQELRHRDDALGHERVLLRRMRDSWQAEREWSRELRSQLRAAHAHGASRDVSSDEPTVLILEAAVKLVGAEKGLLLARADADGDGDLDLVAARGFDVDPEHSSVAQRFARRVVERDEIIREDDPEPIDGEPRPGDEEIQSLVAIPLFLRDRFHGVIVCANREGGFEDVEDDLLLALGDHAGVMLHHGQLQHEVRDAHRSTIRTLSEALAARNPVLHHESGELAVLAGRLGPAIGLDERQTDVLVCATALRAVGYLAIPERPLLRPGPLSPDERDLVQMHSRLGFNILAQSPFLRDVAVTVLYHHERIDGEGYPSGLAGEAIPIAARALAVLETYGALTHDRPYRPALEPEDALEELRLHAGMQLDPSIVERFADIVGRLIGDREMGDVDVLVDTMLEFLPLDPAQDGNGAGGRLSASSIDGLTLLGNHRALIADVGERARPAQEGSFAVAMAELTDLPRVNEELGFLAGDRMVQVAARAARRAAARVGGTAYRESGRRLAVVASLKDDRGLTDLVEAIRMEFSVGPPMRVVASPWEPGEGGEQVVARARDALREN